MTRRRVVVLASALTLLALGGLVVGTIATATRTAWGREQIRAYAEAFINTKIQGKMHIGRVSGSLFSTLVVDSFALREKNDSLFLATGRIRLRFDPRDLIDRRIVIKDLSIQNPYVVVGEDSTKTYNFRKIFPPGPPRPPKISTVPGFGDYIFVDSARLENLTFVLKLPWQPDDSLRGAKRDSAVKYALGREDKMIRRVGSRFETIRTWTNGRILLGPSRIDDRDARGRQFNIRHLDADEFDPPFKFRDVRGDVRVKGDSLWAEIAHFALPGSSGTGAGKVTWGSNLPTRYDLTFAADTVSLADVAWVYPTLPTTGGGKMTLRIVNDERNLRVLKYELSGMDVRTMNSRLRGKMTFATGAPLFAVTNIDVQADPIDWRLIEQFAGEPLPYPWKGTIDATVRASGGPVNRFRVEEGRFFFRDANVPGATARGTVRGELDILEPALTSFRGLSVALDHFDLRTIQFLNPSFPRMSGLLSGTATLDSVWTDVRFRNADLTHRFEDGAPSRFVGNGRVTVGSTLLVYDLAMDALPVDLTTVARAYPDAAIPFRGAFTGPVRLQGSADDLAVTTELKSDAGRITYDGRIDADSVGGYGYHGTLRFDSLNTRVLYGNDSMPNTSLNGVAVVDIVGDSIRNYQGSLDVELERSWVDSVRIYSGTRALVRFADQRMYVDTLHVESALARLSGKGALGVLPEVRDSLVLAVSADSLGAFRQLLVEASQGDSVAMARARTDSLGAELFGRATLYGSIDTLGVRGAFDARGLVYGDYRAKVARVSVSLDDVLNHGIRGTTALTADTLSLSGVEIANLGLDLAVRSDEAIDYKLLTTLSNGPVVESGGTVQLVADTTELAISQLRLAFGDHEWSLTRPATVHTDPSQFSIDTLLLGGSRGGSILIAGTAPVAGEVSLHVALDSLALGDLSSLAQAELAIDGSLALTLDVAGTRASPVMRTAGTITGAKVGQVNVARATLSGDYANRRAVGRLDVMRNDSTVVDIFASYPIDLALESRALRVRDDTLRIAVRSRDLDMTIVEGFVPSITNSTGRLSADFALSGPRNRATVSGFLKAADVNMSVPSVGIRIRNFNADLAAERDTLRIRRFAMVSGSEGSDSLWLGGLLALGGESPAFDVTLGAREFHAINKRSVADLAISADLRLQGSLDRSELSGSVLVNRGFIVIPEFTDKDVISLDDFASYNVVDTSLFANRSLLPKAPPEFVQNLVIRNVEIAMGPEVWLRSAEANINIGGAVRVIVGRRLGSSTTPQLALEGSLQTVRGTYRLALGPVQRTFTIERGQLSFYGDPDLNPVLDINAVHTVRQFSAGIGARNDVRIRVRLLGTLVRPSIVLQSADSLQLSDSDLISYLVVGAPSFEIGGLNRSTYSNLILGGLSSYLSSRLSGGLVDYVQIQTASGPRSQTQASNFLFAGAQFGVGKQLSERTFVSLTAGLCTFQQIIGGSARLNPTEVTNALGLSLEQRLGGGYGFSLSLEPPQGVIFCGAQTNRGFTADRRQFGIDFFRAWRW